MNLSHVQNALAYLYKIVEAGDKGYAVVASNARNRALKILFQSASQQRRTFKEEIFEEIQRLGGQTRPRSSILGMLHRGRIDIFSYFTIGDESVERVLLKEVLLGERVAIRAYEKTIEIDLPPATGALVARQYQEVRKVVDQMRLLFGQDGKRLVLRLYDERKDAEQALQSLKKAGITEPAMEIQDLKPPVIESHNGRGTTILETMLSGAVGGDIWGIVAAVFAAIGILQMASLQREQVSPLVVLFAVLGLIAAGTFIGGMLGLFIGWGVSSQDTQLTEAVRRGEVLLRTLIDERLASKAWQIMNQVAVMARARHVSEAAA